MSTTLQQSDVERLIGALETLRRDSGTAKTVGLPNEVVVDFLQQDSALAHAIGAAARQRATLAAEDAALLALDEEELCAKVQQGFVNFYPADGINPYVPLAAKGPWIVTTHGAVVHDSGGYGMLGLGHNPDEILRSLGEEAVMANVMTPNLMQKRFAERLTKEIGHTREACPLPRFVCLNSGSESVTLTTRIADIHARRMTDPDGPHAGRKVCTLALKQSFHGRTDRPARLSDSTRAKYEEHLASFREHDDVDFVEVNDVSALREAFAQAEREGAWYQAVYLEPVMGEGMPGLAVTRAFYDAARALTREHDALLVVDSIQAALRAQGCLSIVDYPGFSDCEPPDMETFSKALNAGQYPLSVAAMTERVAQEYVTGIYGNTMTSNPKALAVACHVLDAVDGGLRQQIRHRGEYFLARLRELAERHDAVVRVDGTGLMLAAHLDPDRYRATGAGGFSEYLRTHGIEMIHGGDNGLRFTPCFEITEKEIDLIVSVVEQGLNELT